MFQVCCIIPYASINTLIISTQIPRLSFKILTPRLISEPNFLVVFFLCERSEVSIAFHGSMCACLRRKTWHWTRTRYACTSSVRSLWWEAFDHSVMGRLVFFAFLRFTCHELLLAVLWRVFFRRWTACARDDYMCTIIAGQTLMAPLSAAAPPGTNLLKNTCDYVKKKMYSENDMIPRKWESDSSKPCMAIVCACAVVLVGRSLGTFLAKNKSLVLSSLFTCFSAFTDSAAPIPQLSGLREPSRASWCRALSQRWWCENALRQSLRGPKSESFMFSRLQQFPQGKDYVTRHFHLWATSWLSEPPLRWRGPYTMWLDPAVLAVWYTVLPWPDGAVEIVFGDWKPVVADSHETTQRRATFRTEQACWCPQHTIRGPQRIPQLRRFKTDREKKNSLLRSETLCLSFKKSNLKSKPPSFDFFASTKGPLTDSGPAPRSWNEMPHDIWSGDAASVRVVVRVCFIIFSPAEQLCPRYSPVSIFVRAWWL